MEFRRKQRFNSAFSIAMIGGMIAFIAALWVTGGNSLFTVLFYEPENTDRFMDFFNCIYQSPDLRIYQNYGSIYPPVANLIYYSLHRLLPAEVFTQGSVALRDSPEGTLLHLVYAIVIVVTLLGLIYHFANGEKLQRILVAISIGCTAPLLYTVERGNILLLAVIFSFLFLNWRNSPSKKKREIALICLAIAFNIKIYPALLGMLLLKEKRWKESFRCALYAIILFFVPFLLFGGAEAFWILIDSLISTTSRFSVQGYGYKVNSSNLFMMLSSLLGNSAIYLANTTKLLTYLMTATAMIAFPFLKEEWKKIALLCTIIITLPDFSYTYNLCYLFLPLLFLLNQKQSSEATKKDYFYLALFIGAFILIPIHFAPLNQLPGFLKPQFITLVSSICVLVLEVSLILEGFWAIWKSHAKVWAKGILILTPLLLLTIIASKTVFAQKTFETQYHTELLEPVKSLLESEELDPEQTVLLTRYNGMLYHSLNVEDTSSLINSRYLIQEDLPEHRKGEAVNETFLSAFKNQQAIIAERSLYDDWVVKSGIDEIGFQELFEQKSAAENYLLFLPNGGDLQPPVLAEEVNYLVTFDGRLFHKDELNSWSETEARGTLAEIIKSLPTAPNLAINKNWLLARTHIESRERESAKRLFQHFTIENETANYYILREKSEDELPYSSILIKRYSGFYNQENEYCWSQQSSAMELINLSETPQLVRFTATVLAPMATSGSTFTMRVQPEAEGKTEVVPDQLATIELTCTVPPGYTFLDLETTAGQVIGKGDPREMYFRLYNFVAETVKPEVP